MSKHAKLLKYLETGAEVTAKQIQGSFGIKNPYRAVDYLREQGNCIYGNRTTLSTGAEATKYRIGRPSRAMVKIANAVLGSAAFTR